RRAAQRCGYPRTWPLNVVPSARSADQRRAIRVIYRAIGTTLAHWHPVDTTYARAGPHSAQGRRVRARGWHNPGAQGTRLTERLRARARARHKVGTTVARRRRG